MNKSEKTKVLINCLLLSQCSGGYRSYFKNVIIPLTKRLNDNHIITKVLLPQSSLNEYADYFDPQHIIIDHRNKKGFLRIFYEQKVIKGLVKQFKFTKIYTPYQIGPINIADAECILMFRNMEPYVAKNYKYPLRNKLRSLLLRRFSNYYLNQADKVIAISDFTEEFLKSEIKIDKNKISVIPHGISKNKTLEAQIEEDFILTVGSMMPYKRLEDLINAFNIYQLNMENSTELIIIAGESDLIYSQKIKSLIKESPFNNKIHLKGKVPHEEVIMLFSRCQVFVMTSEVEACPNTALEAMSLGCSIISSENQPMPEFFGDSVKYYPFRNTKILAEQIKAFSSDFNLRERYRKRALERSRLYTWESTIVKTENILK